VNVHQMHRHQIIHNPSSQALHLSIHIAFIRLMALHSFGRGPVILLSFKFLRVKETAGASKSRVYYPTHIYH